MNWDQINPRVRTLAETRFNANLYADAIFSVLRDLNSIVKEHVRNMTGNEYDGVDLMRKAFSFKFNNEHQLERDALILFVPDLSTESRRNIQDGYMQIFAGTMSAIRNPKAHDNLEPDLNKTRHLLWLASLLFTKLEEAGINIQR